MGWQCWQESSSWQRIGHGTCRSSVYSSEYRDILPNPAVSESSQTCWTGLLCNKFIYLAYTNTIYIWFEDGYRIKYVLPKHTPEQGRVGLRREEKIWFVTDASARFGREFLRPWVPYTTGDQLRLTPDPATCLILRYTECTRPRTGSRLSIGCIGARALSIHTQPSRLWRQQPPPPTEQTSPACTNFHGQNIDFIHCLMLSRRAFATSPWRMFPRLQPIACFTSTVFLFYERN